MNQLERLRQRRIDIKKTARRSGWSNELLEQYGNADSEVHRLERSQMHCPSTGVSCMADDQCGYVVEKCYPRNYIGGDEASMTEVNAIARELADKQFLTAADIPSLMKIERKLTAMNKRGHPDTLKELNKVRSLISEASSTEPPPLPLSWDRKVFVRVMNKYTTQGVFE